MGWVEALGADVTPGTGPANHPIGALIEARKQNWETLRQGLAAHDDVLEFTLPTHATGWDPQQGFSWDDT